MRVTSVLGADSADERGADGLVKTEDVCGDSGLLKRVLTPGAGTPPRLGARVKIRYVGRLVLSNERFDASLAELDYLNRELGLLRQAALLERIE